MADEVLRNQVTFSFVAQPAKTPGDLATALREHLLALEPGQYRATPVTLNHARASFACAWSEGPFHPIAVVRRPERGTWLIKHEGNRELSGLLQEWLVRVDAAELRWFADADLTRSGSWCATPW